MNTVTQPQTTCAKCLASLQLQLSIHGLSPKVLQEFLSECIQLSNQYYQVTESTLTPAQRVKYKIKHVQAEILLSLLRRADPNR